MKFRHILALLSALALFAVTAAPADAATGPKRLQKLAQAQTGLLLAYFDGTNAVSPPVCGQGQDRNGVKGAFLLPTLSFGSGDQTFTCRTTARRVVVDLGGAVVTEDDNVPSGPYESSTGESILFTPGNLERICDDVLARGYVPESSATLDGRAITGTPVSTRAFRARVNPAGPYHPESVDLGHAGWLATSYCGYKAELRLAPGRHIIRVDLSAVAGAPTVLTYVIDVGR